MVRIRLRRVGSRHQASFRIVVTDRESPRDGRFLEVIGHYNPRTQPATVDLDEARLYDWLQHGAQPSDSLAQILRGAGAWARWERFKGGEALDGLLAEAGSARPPVDARTSRVAAAAARGSKKARAKAAAAEAAPAAEPPAGGEG
jgi:small subunit ribosomal protein S16